MFLARLIKYNTSLYLSIHNWIKVLDKVFLFRPTLFFPVWIVALAGISAAEGIVVNELWWSTNINWNGIILFIGLTLVASSTFVHHQINNKESDRLNQKFLIISQEIVSSEDALILSKLSLYVGLILVICSSIFAAFNGNNIKLLAILWIVLIYGVWGILFHREGFLWFSKPILNVIGNTLVGFFCFMTGWNFFGGEIVTGIIYSIPYVLAFVAVATLTTIPDKEGDEQVNRVTFSIKYGNKSTILLGTIFVIISTYLGYRLDDPVISTASAISIPFFLIALFFPGIHHVLRAIRYPVFILGMFVAIRYPWFFVPLIVTYYLTKYYYYFRFNIDYPTLQVINDKDQSQ